MSEQEWLASVHQKLGSMATDLTDLWVHAPWTQRPALALLYHMLSDMSRDCQSLQRRVGTAIEDMETT